MGYDDRFKSMKRLDSTDAETKPNELRPVPIVGPKKSSLEKQLAKEMTGNLQSREWSTPAISNL